MCIRDRCHADPHLGQFAATCETCHAVTAPAFTTTTFAHAKSRFPLTGKHQDVACTTCHAVERGTFPAGTGEARRFTGVATACASCHKDPHLGQLEARCETCHTTSSFTVKTFAHAAVEKTFFTGRHATAACTACHTRVEQRFPAGAGTAVRYKTGTACASCHTDAHDGALGTACETCHTPALWKTTNRAFHKVARFPLEGRHQAVACVACHVSHTYKATPTRCADCHWTRRQDDIYRTRLGLDCENCHRATSWIQTSWDHGARTGMPLNVAHKLLQCDSCHKERSFTGLRPQCVSCHDKDYRATTSPNHAAAGFPLQCDACHTASAPTFAGARFDHSSFQLTGPHATVTCQSCHRAGVYRGTPRDCIGCHRTDYERTTSPNHVAAGFPTTCESCHRPTDPTFRGATFNHAQVFPLVGRHATQACATCHRSNVYRGTPRDCIGCHRTDYDRTASPNHAAAGFPTTCENCHRPTDASWRGTAQFNHNQVFPLVGQHATQACATCHRNNVYAGTPRDCVGCHKADYDRTAAPNHAAAGFPTSCESCHRASDASWRGAGFNHNAVYPLSGMHQTAACTSCHKNNVYKGTPRDCVSCHRAEYDRTSRPAHAAAGFTTACESCHRIGGPGWTGAAINHSQFWPLLGLHATATCTTCHTANTYKGTPRTCVPCHQAQYTQAANPPHASAGFPTDCVACHKEGGPGWRPATFNHAQFFALQGVHASQACATCHRNNVYRGTPRDCAGCHLARYQATRNPSHTAAGFPTTCETCHRATDTAWTQGRFTHTAFPITSGPHAGNACATCHLDASNFRSFSCTTCHTQTRTNQQHQGRAGYRYDSNACYSCHPNGRAG